jgi:DNA-binding cell septation regulator SpoVG
MIEIKNFEPMEKGTFKGHLSICVPKWGGFVIHSLALMQKDGKRWISFPNKKVAVEGQPDRWVPIMQFEKAETQKQFTEAVLKAFDEQWG